MLHTALQTTDLVHHRRRRRLFEIRETVHRCIPMSVFLLLCTLSLMLALVLSRSLAPSLARPRPPAPSLSRLRALVAIACSDVCPMVRRRSDLLNSESLVRVLHSKDMVVASLQAQLCLPRDVCKLLGAHVHVRWKTPPLRWFALARDSCERTGKDVGATPPAPSRVGRQLPLFLG